MTGRLLAIGDIHGCNHKLQRLLARIDLDPNADKLVFIGDFIDRGPDVRGVIETIIDLKETCKNMICLRGNHEDMFLNYYREGRDEELFFANGGGITLSSYGLTLADARAGRGFPENHLRFIASLPLSYETEAYFFVHAGLRPGIPVARQSTEDLLWIRHEFIDSEYDFSKTVVFGHTALHEPLLEKNKIGIDTGAVYGGCLTCIELPSRKIHQA
ncbi:MAG: serine/threonine protein phosphatase [Proteobacteria bacterium]|nr:serine/threonine protein phosphatase [Pseudomonadota bacterium]MBU2226877.1 serine/threonine protein phosphatase [Pseudomonadota bacterium]MBU2260820.1 serine/threonine protein phosphatase [Pseudomonadota bacterium]